MNARGPMLALLIALTFLWFFLGIGATVVFSFALGAFGDASEGSSKILMGASLASLIFFPMLCGHTIVRGWRRFAEERYETIAGNVLLPLPFLLVVWVLFSYAWE